MSSVVRVAILDDHQSIVDGYLYRLSKVSGVEVVATAVYGQDLDPLLAKHEVDVLLLDVNVPTSAENANPYPILHTIPDLLQRYPDLKILVISMHEQRALIKAIMAAGASGYILKDDRDTIQELGSVVRLVANGGIHFSRQVHNKLSAKESEQSELTKRQLEALSLCATYPDATTADLSAHLGVAHSTTRNLLSGAYLQLGVRSRAAAIAKARQLGLITPESGPEYPSGTPPE